MGVMGVMGDPASVSLSNPVSAESALALRLKGGVKARLEQEEDLLVDRKEGVCARFVGVSATKREEKWERARN